MLMPSIWVHRPGYDATFGHEKISMLPNQTMKLEFRPVASTSKIKFADATGGKKDPDRAERLVPLPPSPTEQPPVQTTVSS